MSGAAVDRVFREASARIIGALAARFRDIALAEDACAESFTRALELWRATGVPDDPAAWLYQVAVRIVLDSLRRRTFKFRDCVIASFGSSASRAKRARLLLIMETWFSLMRCKNR